MSKQYDEYLNNHRGNVAKGYEWIEKNLPNLINEILDKGFESLGYQICIAHDHSKDEQDEYEAYDAYFYGGNRSFKVVQEFKIAWLKHIHRNPHHWQYWILHNDEPGEGMTVLDMPDNYILEMICDWWAFSWAKNDLYEIFGWYDQRKDYMKLSPKTRKRVESILEMIKTKLDEGVASND